MFTNLRRFSPVNVSIVSAGTEEQWCQQESQVCSVQPLCLEAALGPALSGSTHGRGLGVQGAEEGGGVSGCFSGWWGGCVCDSPRLCAGGVD